MALSKYGAPNIARNCACNSAIAILRVGRGVLSRKCECGTCCWCELFEIVNDGEVVSTSLIRNVYQQLNMEYTEKASPANDQDVYCFFSAFVDNLFGSSFDIEFKADWHCHACQFHHTEQRKDRQLFHYTSSFRSLQESISCRRDVRDKTCLNCHKRLKGSEVISRTGSFLWIQVCRRFLVKQATEIPRSITLNDEQFELVAVACFRGASWSAHWFASVCLHGEWLTISDLSVIRHGDLDNACNANDWKTTANSFILRKKNTDERSNNASDCNEVPEVVLSSEQNKEVMEYVSETADSSTPAVTYDVISHDEMKVTSVPQDVVEGGEDDDVAETHTIASQEGNVEIDQLHILCNVCGNIVTRSDFISHNCSNEKKVIQNDKYLCVTCNKILSKANKQRHGTRNACTRAESRGMHTCSLCGVKFHFRRYKKHLVNCKRFAYKGCSVCGAVYECSNYGSLGPDADNRMSCGKCYQESNEVREKLRFTSRVQMANCLARRLGRNFKTFKKNNATYMYCKCRVNGQKCGYSVSIHQRTSGTTLLFKNKHNHDVSPVHRGTVFKRLLRMKWRNVLKRSVAIGKSNDDILSDIRSMEMGFSVSRATLNNMRYRVQRKYWRRYSNDLRSLAIGLAQKRYPFAKTDVIMNRQKISVSGAIREFSVGFMSRDQVAMWNKYAERAVCMDTTFGVSKYKMKLVTVMVVGPNEHGIPVASLVTRREDALTLKDFFGAIKAKVNDLTYKIFMSDDAPSYFSAFKEVFKSGERRLCQVHLFNTFKRKLRVLVTKRKMDERNAIIRELMGVSRSLTNSVDEFFEDDNWKEMIAICREHRIKGYASYLRRNYMNRRTEWMSRFRKFDIVRTNNYCEAYNLKIQTIVDRNGYWHGRIDRFMCCLINAIDSYITNIKFHKPTSYRKRKIQRTHNRFKDEKQRGSIVREGRDKWIVPSKTKKFTTYMVERIQDYVCCEMVCEECRHCKHQFKCDCTYFPFETDAFCIHIHAVCMTQLRDVTVPKKIEIDVCSTDEEDPVEMDTTSVEHEEGSSDVHNPDDCHDGGTSSFRDYLMYLAMNYDILSSTLTGQEKDIVENSINSIKKILPYEVADKSKR